MAELLDASGGMRLFVEVVDREVLPLIPGQPLPDSESARVLGTVSVEYYDKRDQTFWPWVRLPVVYFAGNDGPSWADSLRKLCGGHVPSVGFQAGHSGEFNCRLTKEEKEFFVVEIGVDLHAFLGETSGKVGGKDQGALSLFRYSTAIKNVVTFADGLKADWSRLPPVRKPFA